MMRTILLSASLLATAFAIPAASADECVGPVCVGLFEIYGPGTGCYLVLRVEGHPDRGLECYERTDGPGFVFAPFHDCLYRQTSPTESSEAVCHTFGPGDGNGSCALSASVGSGFPVYSLLCQRDGTSCLATEDMGATEYRYLCGVGVGLLENYGDDSGCYVVLRVEGHPDRGLECYEPASGPGFVLVPFYDCLYKQAGPGGTYSAVCHTFGPDDGHGPCALSVTAGTGAPVYSLVCTRGAATCLLAERMDTVESTYACL